MSGKRFIVYGLVQGVGFRYFVLREARALGLGGFVCNQPDGSVEVVAEGTTDQLAALEARLKEGPALSAVASVASERIDGAPASRRPFEVH
jgi:acylphosphatase